MSKEKTDYRALLITFAKLVKRYTGKNYLSRPYLNFLNGLTQTDIWALEALEKEVE